MAMTRNSKIKEEVAKGLARILTSLRISKPSGKTRSYLKKVTRKLSKQLKADAKKLEKKLRKVSKPGKAAVKKKK